MTRMFTKWFLPRWIPSMWAQNWSPAGWIATGDLPGTQGGSAGERMEVSWKGPAAEPEPLQPGEGLPSRPPRCPQVEMRCLRGCASRCGSEQVGGSCFPPQHCSKSEGLSSAALPGQFVKDLHRINSCLSRPVYWLIQINRSHFSWALPSGQPGFNGFLPFRPPEEDWRPLLLTPSASVPPGSLSFPLATWDPWERWQSTPRAGTVFPLGILQRR